MFGSILRPHAFRADSDIDVGVEGDDGRGVFDFWRALEEAAPGWTFDVRPFDPEDPLTARIREQGVLVYERAPSDPEGGPAGGMGAYPLDLPSAPGYRRGLAGSSNRAFVAKEQGVEIAQPIALRSPTPGPAPFIQRGVDRGACAPPPHGFLGFASKAIWIAWARTTSSGPSMACISGVMIGIV